MPKLLKTSAQNRAIFGLGAKRNWGHEDLRELAFDVTGGRTDSLKALTFDEANGMIRRLGGRAFDQPNQFGSKRTENWRRQKAGIKTIATAKHIDLMTSLARKRGMSEDGLGDLSARVNQGSRKPRTSKEVNRVVEAIKAMNTRDRVFNLKKQEAA